MARVTFDTDSLDKLYQASVRFPQVLRQRMTSAARSVVVPAFREEMGSQPAPSMARRLIIPGSSVLAGFGGYTAIAGTSGERLSGGGVASQMARAWEFGTARRGIKRTVPRKNLRIGSVYHRDTTAQLPSRRRKGWVFYPAMGDLSKRTVPLYVQLAVKTLADTLEGDL